MARHREFQGFYSVEAFIQCRVLMGLGKEGIVKALMEEGYTRRRAVIAYDMALVRWFRKHQRLEEARYRREELLQASSSTSSKGSSATIQVSFL